MSYDTELQLFIDGAWRSGEGRDAHTVVNPVTGSGIADVPYASAADLEQALAAADRAWPEWQAMDVDKRGAILHKAAKLLRERADRIGAVLTQEQGKPIAEAKAEVLGYWIGAKYANQGYMTAAVRAVIPFVFDSLELHRLEAACLPSNTASIKLLEKTGFKREGLARRYLRINGIWQDHLLYALLDTDPRC